MRTVFYAVCFCWIDNPLLLVVTYLPAAESTTNWSVGWLHLLMTSCSKVDDDTTELPHFVAVLPHLPAFSIMHVPTVVDNSHISLTYVAGCLLHARTDIAAYLALGALQRLQRPFIRHKELTFDCTANLVRRCRLCRTASYDLCVMSWMCTSLVPMVRTSINFAMCVLR